MGINGFEVLSEYVTINLNHVFYDKQFNLSIVLNRLGKFEYILILVN
jgi:hypothetical protein